MTRPVIIGAVAAVLLAGGGTAYVLTKDDEKSSEQNTSQTTQDNSSSGNTFDPASTEGLEFKATITTSKDGQETTATLEHDNENRSRYVANFGGQQTETIYTNDAYYICTGEDSCIKYPVSQSSSTGINPGDYTYDESKIAGYRNGANYKGRQSCPAGTCDVWETTANGATSKIYIDTDTKRISQVETTISGATSKIVYDYTDVTITVPTNARSFTTQ